MDNPEKKLSNILRATNGMTFSKDTSARIVGGEKRLEELMISGKIRGEKKGFSQNAKWYINASDVLTYCRNT